MSSTRTSQSVQELRQLIAMLERSGIAEHRPEARALLQRSRALLRERQRGARGLAGKLVTLLTLAMDAAMLGAATMAAILAATGPASPGLIGLALAPVIWLALRLRRHAPALAEAARWITYHLAWLYDWFAEAVSFAAMERLDARITAREVMSGWRQHRRALPHRAGLGDVVAFLEAEYGAQAGRAFRQEAEALGRPPAAAIRGGAARERAAQRLAALRWSALIALFGRLAQSGALWPETLPAGMTAAGAEWAGGGTRPGILAMAATETAPAAPADTPERAARRADLRDLIRRKRQDITTAFGWHLKTEAEISQRDAFLAQTRAEIAELERELAQLGG
ncbi:hypothetical protein [Sediminicoccus rosea]|uniref:DUF2786 domain-containing protein n=1 Tax=Sediminicoccus rosea TaxID=1225128 RepID=A0ABZ0PH88_9PROT|nr:hypothetical protein [Sediminicoccus rosea]WPB84836.1 hypothetical protein R9Z33_22425 [Sediminicoccus rosea]